VSASAEGTITFDVIMISAKIMEKYCIGCLLIKLRPIARTHLVMS